MLFGPLWIDESTKPNTLKLWSLEGCWQMGFKFVDSLVYVVQKFSYFVALCFFKNHEKLDFCTQLVPTTSELNSIGFSSIISPVTM